VVKVVLCHWPGR